MDDVRLAPLVGVLGCLGVLLALLYPYLTAAEGVAVYYGSGLVNPLVVGVLALVTIIILAAGREGRTDPPLAAGAGLVFGLFMVLVSLAWGATVRVDAAVVSPWHRWLLAGVALAVPVASTWYARALGTL